MVRANWRPRTCPACGSTQIAAIFEAGDTVYLSCAECRTLRHLEAGVSKNKPAGSAGTRSRPDTAEPVGVRGRKESGLRSGLAVSPTPLPPQTCRLCGSTELTAAYVSGEVVYLACANCKTLRAIERATDAIRFDDRLRRASEP